MNLGSDKPEKFLRTCGNIAVHYETDPNYDAVFNCMTERVLQCIPSRYELDDTFEFRILGSDELGETCYFEQEYFGLDRMKEGGIAERLYEYAGLSKECEMPAKTVKTYEVLKPETAPMTAIFKNVFFDLATGMDKFCEGDLVDHMLESVQ